MPGVDINYFMRQAKKLTEKVEKRKLELATETVEGKAGDGLVPVVATAMQEIKSIKVDPKAVDPSDLGMLEDLLIAAVNAALSASKEHQQKELAKVTGGVTPGILL